MRKFLASVALATAVVAGTAVVAVPANANTFSFSFSGVGESGYGVLTTGAYGLGPYGVDAYTVTGITGVVNGDVITGLTIWNGSDNLLYYPATLSNLGGYSAPPTYVDIGGIAWTTATDIWNLANYTGEAGVGPTGLNITDNNGSGGNVGVDVALSVTETPLPSAWTMLIAGFVGFGFLAYRGTKKSTALAAA